jgi:hypothetical protein
MLELPGLTNTGDTRRDIDTIRRYLARLVPQLEMELTAARQDGYQDAYSALSQELGSVNKNTTAGALAQHVLDKANPHGVTLAQLGYSADNLAPVELTPGGMTVRVGGKRGLQINVQDVTIELSQWHRVYQHGSAGEEQWQSLDPVCYADAELGGWEREIPLPFYAAATLAVPTDRDCWAGNLSGMTKDQAGTLRVYRLAETGEGAQTEVARTITARVIGLGVYGYGG